MEWTASKYWAAAATCHMPLYFQDPMLERDGHKRGAAFGPLGWYMAYPVDDHTQTTQRNQMVQPFFSVGLFAWQIITWPYALVVDPPWRPSMTSSYWRPEDKIPNRSLLPAAPRYWSPSGWQELLSGPGRLFREPRNHKGPPTLVGLLTLILDL